ncbi:MAG: hypothetical protein A2136_03530 [Chloroflexi bacterium RBG_16_54_11]|nr:MAG: hypothetical protein A2136_03530 [Chloroflexi bacterium RBG_16_54_11]
MDKLLQANFISFLYTTVIKIPVQYLVFNHNGWHIRLQFCIQHYSTASDFHNRIGKRLTSRHHLLPAGGVEVLFSINQGKTAVGGWNSNTAIQEYRNTGIQQLPV